MEDQVYYVMALFDEETNKKIRTIHEELSLNHITSSSILPHLTMGAWVNVDEDALCDWLEKKCEQQHQLEINFNHVGIFSLKVAFISPYVSQELLEFHQAIHEKFEESCGDIGYNYSFKSNSWIPHTTLVSGEDEVVLKSLPIISETFKPFIGRITSLFLCEYNSMREVKIFYLN